MSLFVCEECGVIENTATSRFWHRNTDRRDGKALCSQCDPKIAKWHGHFPRRQYDPATDKPAYVDGKWVAASDA